MAILIKLLLDRGKTDEALWVQPWVCSITILTSLCCTVQHKRWSGMLLLGCVVEKSYLHVVFLGTSKS